jgi:predicted ATPase/DNA-binding SARP family transcriptional activator
VEVWLLGALEVFDDDGAVVSLPGAKLRGLLAALALRPGQVVSAERLIEELWGAGAKATTANSLQGLVSKLRRALPAGAVVTRPPGYVLDVPAESVDVGRFERLVAEGRKALAGGEAAAAAASLREALGLWRGPALAEFVYDQFAQGAIARLGEERAAVLEDRVEADLACGRHAELVAELEETVGAEPLRERLRGQLMVALYRSGRQADGLRQFQEARRVLGEELGLEPGPELRRLEAAMLAHDPALNAPVTAGPLSTAPRRRSNLRAPLTPTIGRDQELADLRSLVAANRLVTIVGPGGAGKTRLAIEVARATHDSFDGGAWFVDLAPLGDASAVVPAIATTLEVPDLPGHGAGTLDRLAEFLTAKDALVVLDNCEHLIGEAARVTDELLAQCPNLRIVATSREGLGVPGERLWPSPPLSKEAAVALFAERAVAVSPTFTLAGGTEAVVREICARVDGLPLAVELAAARVRAFPVGQIAARLDDRFRLLTGGARTALARQQSLQAVVDWSYDLLFDDERRLFNRMSVFAGGCTVDAAIAVCVDDLVTASDIPDLLGRLVDKSVLIVDKTGPESRFSMLQTLGHYAGERLAASGQASATHTLHSKWFAQLAGRSYSAIKGERQRDWVHSVTAEVDNLRAALGWAWQTGDAEAATIIAGGLAWYWLNQGQTSEGVRWLDLASTCAGDASPEARCHAQVWRRTLYVRAGLADPGPDAEELIAIARQAQVPELVAWMRVLLGEIEVSRGDVRAATETYEAARVFYAPQDDPFSAAIVGYLDGVIALFAGDRQSAEANFAAGTLGIDHVSPMYRALCLQQVSNLAESRGDYARASSTLEEAMRTTAEIGFRGFGVTSLVRLANLAELEGNPERAQVLYAQADQLAEQAALQPVLALAVSGLALRHRHAGRLDQAEDAAHRALMLYEQVGTAPGAIGALCLLGFMAEVRGDKTEAMRHHAEALTKAREMSDPRALALCLEGIAGVALLTDDLQRSAALLGAAHHLRGARGLPPDAVAEMVGTVRGARAIALDDRFDAERIEASARKQLGSELFEAAYAAGAMAALDELVGV